MEENGLEESENDQKHNAPKVHKNLVYYQKSS